MISRLRIILTLLLIGASLATSCSSGRLSDDQLRQLFSAKRGTFESLALMLAADRDLERITVTEVTYISNDSLKLSTARLESYRQAMTMLGEPDIQCIRRYDGTILILLSSTGLAVGGTTKGIAFLPDEKLLRMFTVVPNLDDGWRDRGEGQFLVPIDKHWYVYGGA
jgi:hypothetical protein